MREILFRGKAIGFGKWAYGHLIKVGPCYYILELENDELFNDGHIDEYLTLVSPKTIGQWTGLVDKNGTKIFEGDVVQEKRWLPYREPDSYLVHWTDMSCGFEPFSDSCENCGHCGAGLLPDDMEVIGNIHDNPELMKAEGFDIRTGLEKGLLKGE